MTRPRFTCRVVTFALPVVAALAFAGSASAARTRIVPFIPGPHVGSLVHIRHGSSVSSTNWSGYAVEDASPFTEVLGSWVQPAATCNELAGSTYAAFWAGIDGYTSSSVEQLGTDSDCTGRNSPSYYAWWEMYPADSVDISTSQYPVKPGDTLTASVTVSSDNYTLSLKSSEGWTFSTTQSGSYAQSSAELIAEAPDICSVVCTNAKLTDFGTVNFSNVDAGVSGAAADPFSAFTANGGPLAITMTNQTGTTRAVPSALSSGGNAFSDTWKHS
jgi:peptidase A4-like protein